MTVERLRELVGSDAPTDFADAIWRAVEIDAKCVPVRDTFDDHKRIDMTSI
jgi:hypothetical protein